MSRLKEWCQMLYPVSGVSVEQEHDFIRVRGCDDDEKGERRGVERRVSSMRRHSCHTFSLENKLTFLLYCVGK